MYLEEGGTYLEEFITALEFVPNDIRGNFELIRELDKESIELNKELADLQSNYLDYLNKKLDSDLAFFETELRGCGEFDSVKGQYDIADIDDSKRYYLPESQVLSLDSLDYTRKFSKGEIVYAVYPDTTSFYQAVITHVNKKSINHLHEPSVTVQFDGDADPVTGVSPLYVVSMKYVLKLPAIK
eukprot:gene21352-27662_t